MEVLEDQAIKIGEPVKEVFYASFQAIDSAVERHLGKILKGSNIQFKSQRNESSSVFYRFYEHYWPAEDQEEIEKSGLVRMTPSRGFGEILIREGSYGQTILESEEPESKQTDILKKHYNILEELLAFLCVDFPDELAIPNGEAERDKLPVKKKKTRKNWAKVFQIYLKLKEEYQDYYYEGSTDDPDPNYSEIREALIEAGHKPYSDKRLRTIIEAGNEGLLDEYISKN